MLEKDLQGALQQRRDTERHNKVRHFGVCEYLDLINLAWRLFALPVDMCVCVCVCGLQDLQLALVKAQSALQEREELLKEGEQERRQQDEDREATIRELRTLLLAKEQLIEVSYAEANAPYSDSSRRIYPTETSISCSSSTGHYRLHENTDSESVSLPLIWLLLHFLSDRREKM